MLHRCLSLRHCQITFAALLTGFSTLFPAQATTIRLANVQVSEPEQFDIATLDLGVRAAQGTTRAGLRLTFQRMSEHYVPFIEVSAVNGHRDDLAINGEVDFSGPGGGIGLYYTGLPDWMNMTTTLSLSAHREKSDVDTLLSVSGREGIIKSDLYSQTISVLFSPRQPLRDNGLNGYVSVGLSHDRESRVLRLDGVPDSRLSERRSQVNGTLEAGLVYPTGRFRLHAVATYQDEFSLLLGLRYQLSHSGVNW